MTNPIKLEKADYPCIIRESRSVNIDGTYDCIQVSAMIYIQYIQPSLEDLPATTPGGSRRFQLLVVDSTRFYYQVNDHSGTTWTPKKRHRRHLLTNPEKRWEGPYSTLCRVMHALGRSWSRFCPAAWYGVRRTWDEVLYPDLYIALHSCTRTLVHVLLLRKHSERLAISPLYICRKLARKYGLGVVNTKMGVGSNALCFSRIQSSLTRMARKCVLSCWNDGTLK